MLAFFVFEPSVMKPLLALFLALLCSLSPKAYATSVLNGRVIHIADGDTLTLIDADYQRIKVRLAEIDSPEKAQPYGHRAKQLLVSLALKKTVEVTVVDIDQYGRIVGKVRADGVDINAEMVRQGAAWVYRRHLKRPELLRDEQEARKQALGLWALPEKERMPPWQWRHLQRQSKGRAD